MISSIRFRLRFAEVPQYPQDDPRIGPNRASDPYEAAIRKALEERDVAERDAQIARDDLALKEARVTVLSRLVETLCGQLSPEKQIGFLDRINKRLPPAANASVSNKVVALCSSAKRDWSAPEIRRELEHQGVTTELKQVQNSLNYLEKKHYLVKLGRGRYFISGLGVGLVTSDDYSDGDEFP